MLRVAFDGQIFSTQIHGGVSRLFAETINELDALGVKTELTCKFSQNEYMSGKKILYDWNFPGKTTLLKKINIAYSINKLKKGDFDIFHPTNFNPYFLKYIGNKPLVVTVYDLIYERYPKLFPKSSVNSFDKSKILERADAIIAISENTKKDIERFYGQGKKTTVIYLANSLKKTKGDKITGLPKKYLLFVGTRNKYKNFNNFIKALPKGDFSVVCVGGGKFTDEENNLICKKGLKSKVVQLTLKEEQMSTIYTNATAFVYPSLYEGFGLPVLEAFAFRCPVVASNTSSIPEVGDDACLYFNPNKLSDIKNKVEKILGNQKLRKKLIKKGYERQKLFSWKRTAKQTLDVYKKVLEKR